MQEVNIILENSIIFNGNCSNLNHNITGELIFNTGMVGYEEILTDPSYENQIIVFTYPSIGNYGVGKSKFFESKKICVKAIICETIFLTDTVYSYQERTFLSWINKENIPLITDVDTRELTKVIRNYGSMNAILTNDKNINFNLGSEIIEPLKNNFNGHKIYGNGKYEIIVVDCGIKKNIIRCLLEFNVQLKIVPFDYDYTKDKYDGVVISNGPGNPLDYYLTTNILKKAMLKAKPIFGICLGAQIMGHSIGMKTFKLKFGHHGHNQPCIDLSKSIGYLTAQNHNYALDELTLPENWLISFRNLNDNTVAGIKHKSDPFFSVQFHPEAAAGPHDTKFLFGEFMSLVKENSL